MRYYWNSQFRNSAKGTPLPQILAYWVFVDFFYSLSSLPHQTEWERLKIATVECDIEESEEEEVKEEEEEEKEAEKI